MVTMVVISWRIARLLVPLVAIRRRHAIRERVVRMDIVRWLIVRRYLADGHVRLIIYCHRIRIRSAIVNQGHR